MFDISYFQIQSTTEQFQFVTDEVNVVVKEAIREVLENEKWDPNRQEQWNNRIMEIIVEQLAHVKKPFKYVVHCTSIQKAECNFHVGNACFWNTTTDGSVTVRWENPYIYAVVSVFGIFVQKHFGTTFKQLFILT